MPDPRIEAVLRRAVETGDSFAEFEAGLDWEYGRLGAQSSAKASTLYERAAQQGHAIAEGNLLGMHIFGRADSYQSGAVVAKLTARARKGDQTAQVNLGLCYQRGYGVPQDYVQAAEWYARAAKTGAPEAQFNLGGFYYEGKGKQQSLKKAVHWYTLAAQQGYELALLHLGQMYQKGRGVQVDLSRAIVLYLIAYRRGSARAANHLGFMLMKGLGAERDEAFAYELYLKSLNRPDTPDIDDNPSYRATAYYWLGYMSEHGIGIKKNLRGARTWYRQGAKLSQPNCLAALARLGKRANTLTSRKHPKKRSAAPLM